MTQQVAGIPAEPEIGIAESASSAPGALRDKAKSPIREVLEIRAYRNFWISSFLVALVNGTLRFAFIWLVITELTDWPPAAGVLGIAIGTPALLLSLPAGALSDRTDRKALLVRGASVASLFLLITAILVWTKVINIPLVILMAAAIGSVFAMVLPTAQAMVPTLVPRERLVSGVALQNIGMQVSQLAGNLIGGAAITLFGTGGAFGILAGLQAVSAFSMTRVDAPTRPNLEKPKTSAGADIVEGLRFVIKTEPMRSLMIVSLLIGVAISFFAVNVPNIATDILGRDAFGASLLFGALGLGMMSTSLFMASRRENKRLGAKLAATIGGFLGPGIFLVGWSKSYALTLGILFFWAMCGGIAVTTHRSLIQSLCDDRLMGRVMAVNTLLMMGSFPLGAALTAIGIGSLGPDGMLMAGGAAIFVVGIPVTMRKAIRTA